MENDRLRFQTLRGWLREKIKEGEIRNREEVEEIVVYL